MLSKRIKSLRLNKDMTQKELSDILGLTPKMVSFYELGDRVPPPDVLEKLADIFNVTTDYLLCRTGFVTCKICHNSYDPLNEYDAKSHEAFHKKFIEAENKFGEIMTFGEASQKRDDSIFRFRNPALSIEEKIEAYGEYLKCDFIVSLWNNNLDINHDDFETFCKKELGLVSTKEALEAISTDFYKALVDKYGVLDSQDVHKVIQITDRDNRDIKKDIDNIMEKLSNKEYGPAAYDGQDLSDESLELFRDELEIALKRLKLINKEKYNPNKNKK